MTLQEAIELLTPASKQPTPNSDFDFQNAIKLLIEAGKLIIQHPTIRFFLEEKLLPGETEE